MLKVLPVQSKISQEENCLRCGVKYDPDLLSYAATVDDELCGVSQFKLTDKGGMVYDIAPVTDTFDFESLFVLGRGTLNFIDLCGVHKAYFEDGSFEGEGMIKSIGFSRLEDGRWFVDLTDFFVEPCQHGHGLKQD